MKPCSSASGTASLTVLPTMSRASNQVLIVRVGELEDVAGAVEDGEEGRSLIEQIGEPLCLLLEELSGHDGFGGFGADDKDSADVATAADRTVAVGPVDVFEFAVAIDGDELVFVPAGLTAGHDRFDLRADDGPNLGPALFSTLAESAGVLVLADAGTVSIVIKLDVLFAPPEEHGMAGAEDGVDGGDEGLRPLLDGTDRGHAPVVGAGEVRHLACADRFGVVRINCCLRKRFLLPGLMDRHEIPWIEVQVRGNLMRVQQHVLKVFND